MIDKCCSKCGETKSLSEFHKSKNTKDGYHPQCRDCKKGYVILQTNNCENQRKSHLKMNYGLTIQEYNRLFDGQKGCCAICGKHQSELRRTLAVDHNHKTGQIKGLLCDNCNLGLGNFQESRGILIKAIQYLGKKK